MQVQEYTYSRFNLVFKLLQMFTDGSLGNNITAFASFFLFCMCLVNLEVCLRFV